MCELREWDVQLMTDDERRADIDVINEFEVWFSKLKENFSTMHIVFQPMNMETPENVQLGAWR